jgi:hypothetical protein
MMDIENYKGAVAWLRSNLEYLRKSPSDPVVQFALLQSFEVTHNLSEAVLREMYVSLGVDEFADYLSLRELIWRAGEEGIVLSCRKDWMEYGSALERMRDTLSLSANGTIADADKLLSRFADDLESFARCVERRLARNA